MSSVVARAAASAGPATGRPPLRDGRRLAPASDRGPPRRYFQYRHRRVAPSAPAFRNRVTELRRSPRTLLTVALVAAVSLALAGVVDRWHERTLAARERDAVRASANDLARALEQALAQRERDRRSEEHTSELQSH